MSLSRNVVVGLEGCDVDDCGDSMAVANVRVHGDACDRERGMLCRADCEKRHRDRDREAIM